MFGDNLKTYRIAKGLSQSDIAEKLFVSRQCVSKWEKGITEPDVQTLARLSEILNVTVDALINDNSKENDRGSASHNFGLFVANILIALFCCIAFIVVWRFVPPIIPAHWTNGVIDRYGSRNEVLINLITPAVFLIVDIIVYFALRRINDKRAEYILHGVFAVFQIAYLIFIIALYAKYITEIFSLITCLSADLIMCATVAMHPKISKQNYILGVRTTATLKSATVWNKTNALGCYLFTGCSLIILAVNMSVLLDLSYLFLLAYILPAIISVVYSKIVYRRTAQETDSIGK